MDLIPPECASQSFGPVNQLFSLLIKTILASQCAISPASMWPDDYGEKILKKGFRLN